MRNFLLIILIILPCIALCVTRTVSLDGSQQYTSIQTAIDACNNGDIVLVYPGRYMENLDSHGHHITLASLYLNSPQQSYIENTIIDGNLESCLIIESGEHVSVNGFTFINNELHLNTYVNRGGAIRVGYENTYLYLYNSIIRDCSAIDSGGIGVGLRASLFLSNVKIYNNKADRSAGGLAFNEGTDLVFDAAHPSAIYNNFASQGMDMFIKASSSTPTPTYNIYLNMSSIILTQPDYYFIGVYNVNLNLNIQQAYLTQIDSDMYVSPEGNDSNAGISASAPMKTIAYALQKIVSNPDNPHTLHLAAGSYSFSENAQMLPLGMKSHVKVIGAGLGSTIIDGEFMRAQWGGLGIDDSELSDMTMIQCRSINSHPLYVEFGSELCLRNLVFEDCFGYDCSGMFLVGCDNTIIENVIVKDISFFNDVMSLRISESDNIYVNNVITNNNHVTDPDVNKLRCFVF